MHFKRSKLMNKLILPPSKEFLSVLLNASGVLITPHEGPDGDAVASGDCVLSGFAVGATVALGVCVSSGFTDGDAVASGTVIWIGRSVELSN